jgi:hypothetical protein
MRYFWREDVSCSTFEINSFHPFLLPSAIRGQRSFTVEWSQQRTRGRQVHRRPLLLALQTNPHQMIAISSTRVWCMWRTCLVHLPPERLKKISLQWNTSHFRYYILKRDKNTVSTNKISESCPHH